MSILTAYQFVFMSAIAGTIFVAFLAKRSMARHPVADGIVVQDVKPVMGLAESVKDRIKAIDRLFDDHLLSVDEYVELRKRISGGHPIQPSL
jgi:hypothetical protein